MLFQVTDITSGSKDQDDIVAQHPSEEYKSSVDHHLKTYNNLNNLHCDSEVIHCHGFNVRYKHLFAYLSKAYVIRSVFSVTYKNDFAD